MASRRDHEYFSEKKFGIKGTAIHRYLDGQFGKYGARHRHLHHHWEGIKRCAKIVGHAANIDYNLAKMIAEDHIRLDFNIQGYQLQIPHYEDYLGGDGSWPTGMHWSNMCPWDTDLTDKSMRIEAEIIEEVEEKMRKKDE